MTITNLLYIMQINFVQPRIIILGPKFSNIYIYMSTTKRYMQYNRYIRNNGKAPRNFINKTF